MSMLNFKYGKFSGLFNTDGSNKLALNEGTVYITTDEKAMYVDLNTGTAVERIRLSQIVNIPTEDEWLALKPPFSTEAFYYVVDANALLKYNGKEWVQINSVAALETAIGQLESALSKLSGTVDTNASTMNTHIANKSNPHGVTKSQVGLGNVENKSTATIKTQFTAAGVSENESGFTTGAQVYGAVKDVTDDLNSHTGNKNNPHKVTKAQVGLENVDNTSDANKPVSTAQQTAINTAKEAVLGKSSDAAGAATVAGANKAAAAAKEYAEGVQTNLTTHENKKDNPHGVTKAQVGLGDVENKSTATIKTEFTADSIANGKTGFTTGDLVYDYIQALRGGYTGTLKGLSDATGTVSTNLNTHVNSKNNPHGVTKAQVGLGNVDNTSDENKPVSTAQAQAITDAKNELLGDSSSTAGSATISGANKAAAAAQSYAEGVQTNLTTHVNTQSGNPHKVTKSDVGLSKVNNWGKSELLSNLKTDSIADTKTGFATGDQVYDYIQALRGTYTGTLQALNASIETNATNIGTNATNISNLDARVTNLLQTADALKYIGTVSSFSALPTTSSSPKPEKGWVYKVVPPPTSGASIKPVFSLTKDQANSGVATQVYVGDLLIATGTETNGVLTTLKWDHIPSGYVADYNPKFTLSGADASGTDKVDSNNAVVLNLTSGASSTTGDLGKLNFKTDGNSAIRIAASNTASGTASLTLSLAWGTF